MKQHTHKHSLKLTEDGTYTLYNSEFDENTHTIHGAYSEALYKHIYPSKILHCQNETIAVLDVGFGLGYNLLALLCELQKTPFKGNILIDSFEKDDSFLDLLKTISFDGEKEHIYKKIIHAYKHSTYSDKHLTIRLHWNDARKNVTRLQQNIYDVIFHDPHSPHKNCELWTVNFFEKLYTSLKSDGVLTTYSFSDKIRRAMLEAGFSVFSYKHSENYKEGTIAYKKNIDSTENRIDKALLENDLKSTPYRDNTALNLSVEEIRQNRLDIINKLRTEKK